MPKLIQNQLTVRKIATLDKPGRYADGLGLYLQVAEAGHKSWTFLYTLGARRREMGLGPVYDVSLAQARQAAAEARALVRKLIDPIDERNRRRAEVAPPVKPQVKFDLALDMWLRNQNLARKHEQNVRSPIVTYISPSLGKLPVASITPQQIYDALMTTKTKSGQPFWGMNMGTRAVTYLSGLFRFCHAKGWRENPINPADPKQLQLVGPRPQAPETTHFAGCPYERIAECYERLTTFTDIVSMCLRWQILVAARPGEALRLQWDWIDLTNRIVTIPGPYMKEKREHKIPISAAAFELLEMMRAVRTCDYVFPSPTNKPLSVNILARRAKQAMPDMPSITAHGFRSTFRTWGREATDFETDMLEIALAHKVTSTVEDAYMRGSMLQKRRSLMNAWADYCQGKGVPIQFRSEFLVEVA